MLPDRVSNPGPLTYESGACNCQNKWFVITTFLRQTVGFSVCTKLGFCQSCQHVFILILPSFYGFSISFTLISMVTA